MREHRPQRARSAAGLTAIEPETGVLVAYAARDGTTALDGDTSANSPYADALVTLYGRAGPGDQPAVPQGARRRADKTGKQQEPYTYGSLPAQPFYFRR